MISRAACSRTPRGARRKTAGRARHWLFPWLLACLVLIPPAHSGLIDQFTDSITGPAAVEDGCRKGRADLCTSAGNMYRQGYKVTKDTDKAIEYYLAGCAQGETKSCHALYQIGFDNARGKGTTPDMPSAVKLFTAACEGSASGVYSGPACHELAKLYLAGQALPKDPARGVALLHRGCDRTSRRACRDLGDILLEGDLVPVDLPGAVKAYRRACDGKDKEHRACAQLGTLLKKGEQASRDIPAAEKYLNEACTFPVRIGSACYELALLYEKELAGEKTEEEITELYHIACHRADSEKVGEACVAAAGRHLQGRGAKKDPNWVIDLYNRGCKLKHPDSCRLSCEWNCTKGQPHACAAVKAGRYPLGSTNCVKP